MKIERDKWYLSRRGEKIRVICVDAGSYMPVIGIDERGNIDKYRADGGYHPSAISGESPIDLVSEYVELPKPREVWVNIYPDGLIGSAWEAKGQAYESVGSRGVPTLFREVIE